MTRIQEKILPLGPNTNANKLFVGLYNGDRAGENVQAISELVTPWGLEISRAVVGKRKDAKPALQIRSREGMDADEFNSKLERLAATLRDKDKLMEEAASAILGQWNTYRLLSLFTDSPEVAGVFNNPQILNEFTELLESK